MLSETSQIIQQRLHLLERQNAEKEQLAEEMTSKLHHAEDDLKAKPEESDQYWQILDIQPEELQLHDDSLGKGSYGVVQLGDWCGIQVAMETFDKNLQLAQGFKKELTAYCQLHHPNIVPVSGVVMSK
ncbi:probable serine/threonine-protein kinase DDB_G0267514 [Corticium candelabrum]|uniref:probable serine/threonine-protein kinase DDB_G0267514 n=1 Tax=Corticium candelabrum TaxID=121492 RepID=UPI002E2576C1|nr:probable serine/threonine-protein kinase DDB_G0267514 [Corticium candelabrum]